MRSKDTKVFYFQADANSLGGFVDLPFPRSIPSQASVSLPSVGGQANARTGAFNFDEILTCRAAYTRVSGHRATNGSRFITATAVVEGLNILDTFIAERLVAQVSVEYPEGGEYLKVSLAGTSFDGLRIGGCDATPALNVNLLCGAKTLIEYPTFKQTGHEQADKLIDATNKQHDQADFQWLRERFDWMASNRKLEDGRCVLASVVDGIPRSFPGETFGHAVDIPEFGTVFLGEVFVCTNSVQVFSFRAELGCGTTANIGGPAAQVRGHPYP